MIAELFYPKELKDIIVDLRAKDDLNDNNFKNMRSSVNGKRLLSLLASIICFVFSYVLIDQDAFYILIICGLAFLLFSILPSAMLNQYIVPYNAGKKVKAKITGAHYDPIPSHGYTGWSIKYEFFDDNNKKYSGACNGVKLDDLNKDKIELGEEIEIFYVQSKPSKNVPLLKSKYIEFSLSKSR